MINNINGKKFVFIIIIFAILINLFDYQIPFKNINITSFSKLIISLKKYIKYGNPKYIIFSDNILNKDCSDINAFTVFDYYMKNNITNAYYIVNIHSDLYSSLVFQNKTKNLIYLKKNNTIIS